jgi:hypothetical protein
MLSQVVGPCTTGDNASLTRRARQNEVIEVDSARFDELTRELSMTGSRRETVKTFLAAGLGLGLTWLAVSESLAKKKNRKKKRKKKRRSDVDTIGLQQPCTSDKQCVGDLVCQIANSQNGFPERATQPVCCVPPNVGGRCNSGADCCGISPICNGGFCQG